MKILNIFCDASIRTFIETNVTVGCAGFIATENSLDIINQNLLYLGPATNNYAEIMAVLISVYYAASQRDNYDVINITSDSKLCIFGLREWMYNWMNNENDGILYGTGNVPIKNQGIFLEIVNIIMRENLKINFYHQKGHVTQTHKSLTNALRVFKENNSIDLSMETIKCISYFNDTIDVLTKKALNALTDYNPPKLVRPCEFTTDCFDQQIYSSLLNSKEDDYGYKGK